MVLLMVMVVQVAVFYHSRAVAQTAARHGLDQARVLNGSTDAAIAVTNEFLNQAGGGLRDPQVSADRTPTMATVSVTAHVVSILPFTDFTVSVTVDAPTERIEP